MSGSTAIALASIGASATVALVVPIVTHMLSRSRDGESQTHDLTKQDRALTAAREVADVEELRVLLDEVVQNAARGLEGFRELRSILISDGSTLTDRGREVGIRFRETGRTVDIDTQRVAIRLGPGHPLTLSHARIGQAMADTLQHVVVAQNMGDHADLATAWSEVTKSGDAFYAARDVFAVEAAALVGARIARLGPERKPSEAA
jgi:hypothetical protein